MSLDEEYSALYSWYCLEPESNLIGKDPIRRSGHIYRLNIRNEITIQFLFLIFLGFSYFVIVVALRLIYCVGVDMVNCKSTAVVDVSMSNHGVYKNEKIKIPDLFQTFFLFSSLNFYSTYNLFVILIGPLLKQTQTCSWWESVTKVHR